MENASKALLIAGAILIVILIIGIGMLVYTSTTGTIDEAVRQMSSQEKDMFNQQFEQYSGDRVNGANVKALLRKIRDNNTTNDGVEAKQVVLSFTPTTGGTAITDPVTAIQKVNTAGSYTVTCTDAKSNYAGDGLIDTVTITYNKKSGS